MDRFVFGGFGIALITLGIIMINGHRRHLRKPTEMALYHQINLGFGWVFLAGGVVLMAVGLVGG